VPMRVDRSACRETSCSACSHAHRELCGAVPDVHCITPVSLCSLGMPPSAGESSWASRPHLSGWCPGGAGLWVSSRRSRVSRRSQDGNVANGDKAATGGLGPDACSNAVALYLSGGGVRRACDAIVLSRASSGSLATPQILTVRMIAFRHFILFPSPLSRGHKRDAPSVVCPSMKQRRHRHLTGGHSMYGGATTRPSTATGNRDDVFVEGES
jgi:hypothetical protein